MQNKKKVHFFYVRENVEMISISLCFCLNGFLTFPPSLLLYVSPAGEVVYRDDRCWKSLQRSQQAVRQRDPGACPAVCQR